MVEDGQTVVDQDTFVVWVARTSWENLPQLVQGALYFSLCCLPAFLLFGLGLLAPMILVSVLTIAPAWAALLAHEQQLFLGQPHSQGKQVGGYWWAFRRYWRTSVLLGALGCFPVMAALLTLPTLQQTTVPWIVWAGLAADFLGMALLATLLLYAFPLLVHPDLRHVQPSVRVLLRNALLLAVRQPASTIGLLGMAILFGFAIGALSLGLLFLLPAFYGMFVVGNGLLALQREC